MKKISCIVLSVLAFSLVIFSGLLMSCELSEERPEAKIESPGIEPIREKTGGGFTISIHNLEDVKYVNIYRQDVTYNDNLGKVINIGILFPEYYHSQTWLYEDTLVYSTHKYQYCVKYTRDDGTYKSGWTNVVSLDAISGYDDTLHLFKYTVPESAVFIFDDEEFSLTLSNASILTNGIDSEILKVVKPKIIFSNGSVKRVYTLPNIEDGSILHLRTILEPAFMNCPISIEGIIFEKTIRTEKVNDDDVEKVRCVIWGEPSDTMPLLVKKGNGAIDSITVRSTTEEPGYDYTE